MDKLKQPQTFEELVIDHLLRQLADAEAEIERLLDEERAMYSDWHNDIRRYEAVVEAARKYRQFSRDEIKPRDSGQYRAYRAVADALDAALAALEQE